MAAIPAIRTTTVLTPSLRVAARARSRTQINVWVASGVFLALTYLFFCAASLAGNVLAERPRRRGIKALPRSNAARPAEANLERRLDSMRSLAAIDAWAAQNGFVASDRSLQTSMRPNDGKPQT